MSTYILAEYNSNGNYDPVEIAADLDNWIDNFEYQDVKDGMYQIWEYPNGKIFKIVPDRELGIDENQYSTPHTNKGTVWFPELVEVVTNEAAVSDAYQQLQT